MYCLGDDLTSGYKFKMKELHDRLEKANGDLRDSIKFGFWELVTDDSKFKTRSTYNYF